ncbi:hypothetical protein BABINDRAFT_39889 [Babjeviella inositovora NRRL Y-12698]|uniref:Zn(2)-C6 fungal-type domain-containing protein n=1 Tax=Babjeviella inositovora NRRL Y-12698 TaxID=984486 RepID=A0A1E3QL23_9ASCO|nr:uncharacterized protein BABINDRAFT_39889 [Babjeviella inositovora NRRL Y-12698]ODQ78318.1 hypothetical protein BABINDRAFT_39889 [Babjeviella inositovora NRRL Y-12698]
MSTALAEEKIRFKRNYKACLNCRMRKVKCDLGSVDSPHDPPCARCSRERRECTFVESRRGGSANVVAGRKRKTEDELPDDFRGYSDHKTRLPPPSSLMLRNPEYSNGNSADSRSVTSPRNSKYSHERESESALATMRGAMVFLAKAAGTIANADERDNIDARTRVEALEQRRTSPPLFESPSEYAGTPPALPRTSLPRASIPKLAPLIRPDGPNRASIPQLDNTDRNLRPLPSTELSDIYYIGPREEGCILTEAEAVMLINCFYSNLHPFYPHIPPSLHAPRVLAGYPLLLGAILTISARYHAFGENDGKIPRNVEVHERLWIYVQRLISQTVWAESSTRSMTTVFAFLLFTEWNPRAIHWRWSDYANTNKPDDLVAPQEHIVEDSDQLAGLGAVRRSDRMAWMLIGSAVRLAQDMGFIENSAHVFLATHVSETTSAMNINRRSMLAPSLAEIDLEDLEAESEEMEEDFLEDTSDKKLRFNFVQKLKIELLQVMSIGYEYLYGCKAQLSDLTSRQKLAVLSILSPLIEKWGIKYKKLLVPSNFKYFNKQTLDTQNPASKVMRQLGEAIDRESIICDYYYARLYIYSLALANDNSKLPGTSQLASARANTLKLGELSKSAKFVELAFNSAKEILAVSQRVHKMKMLKFMSVRWCTRIVRAVAFVVKCYLTMTAAKKMVNAKNETMDSNILSLSIIPVDELIHIIQKAAITLREASPDELHLCTRYSTILMYLCLKVKTSTRNDDFFSGTQNTYTSSEPTNYEKEKYEPPEYQNFGYQKTHQPNLNLQPQPQPNHQPNQYQTSLDDDLFNSDLLFDWFNKNDEIGLDFVEPWTAMLEQSMANGSANGV